MAKKLLTVFAALVALGTTAYAQSLSSLPAGASVAGSDLFYDVQTPGIGGVKVTAAQIAAYHAALSETISGVKTFSVAPIFTAGFTSNTIAPTFAAGASLANNVTLSGITGSTQCLQVNTSGVISGSGAVCGGGGGTITANSTPTSGFAAGEFVYSDGAKVQATSIVANTVFGFDASFGVDFENGYGIGFSTTANAITGAKDVALIRGTTNTIYVSTTNGPNQSGNMNMNNGSFGGKITNAGITTDSAQTATATVCEDTTTHVYYFGSGTAGICKGTSSIRFKQNIGAMTEGLREVMAMRPVQYFAKPDYGDPNKPLYGLLAEDMELVSKVLTEHDSNGKPSSVDYIGIVPVLIRAIQQQQAEIESLKARLQ